MANYLKQFVLFQQCFALFLQPISTIPGDKRPPCIGDGAGDLTRDSVRIFASATFSQGAYVFAIGI